MATTESGNHILNFEEISKDDKELWTPEYGNPRLDTQLARTDGIVRLLRKHDTEDIEEKITQTKEKIWKVFDEYLDKKELQPEGSFAFIVPTRIQRKGNNKGDYTAEVDPLFTLLQHVDNSTKQVMMSGMPPFIVDRYRAGDDGRAGAIIFAPVLMDLFNDVPPEKWLETSDRIMNQTTDFARNTVGANVASFAAVLPRIIRYGEAIKTEGLTTTTGHGATTHLISESLKQARHLGLTRSSYGKLGILGTGAIGEATAYMLLHEDSKAHVVMSDKNTQRGSEVQAKLSKQYPNATIEFTTDNSQVVEGCEVTICAAAAQFNLDSDDLKDVDFDEVFIIDDSQPGAFSPEQVRSRGGEVVWPVGLDKTLGRLGTRKAFDYMNTGPAQFDEIYSCEAEVLALSVTGEYDKSIQGPVTTEQAVAIGSLMKQANITIAPPQCLGAHLQLG